MKPVIKLGDSVVKWTLSLLGVEMTRSWAEEEMGDESAARREAGHEPTTGEPSPGTAPAPARSELRRQMGEILSRSRVPPDRREEIMASMDIDEIPCRDIMASGGDVVTLSLEVSLSENLKRIGRAGHTRYPVLKRDQGFSSSACVADVAGILYLPSLFSDPDRLLEGSLRLDQNLQPAMQCDPTTPVAQVIDQLQAARQELALVTEGDKVLGVVTITDALEEISGEVEDPLDRERSGGGNPTRAP